MPIYEFSPTAIDRLDETTFGSAGLRERRDLQRLLRERIDVISPETLVIAEEFGDWEDSRRRIDLLGIDKDANIVVIELKRTEDGGHMDLQAIRYASMVARMTFDQAVDVFARYLQQIEHDDREAREALLEFLGWSDPSDGQFGQEVRIVLASADFSKELASSVLWLIDHELDIRCIRLKAYTLAGRLIVDVQQIIPLPEAADYQFQLREKTREERQARVSNADFTRFDVKLGDEAHHSMNKRRAILLICKRLCDEGVSPEDIAALFEWRSRRIWYFVDGIVDRADFERLASKKAAAVGPAFDKGRWFCQDDELVHQNGKTYAFSKMWGGQNWVRAMTLLKERYPALNVDFSAAA